MKVVSLISSGIDSPVSTYIISKKSDKIFLIYADITPFTDGRDMNNFKKLLEHLKKILDCKSKAYIVPHGEILSAFRKERDSRFTCVFCKRMLLRYAENIANEKNADAVVMGDSLGQVASQTLQNIKVIENSIDLPVLRPLIGWDKEEIVEIAKSIGTYDISILESGGCDAVPEKPVIESKIKDVLKEEKKLDVDGLVCKVVKNATLIPV